MTGNSDGVLSDARIAAMSPAERRDLIQRPQRPLDEVHPLPIARRMRRNRLTLMVGGAIGLIPWIVYLGFTLPATYVAQNWPAVWMGFDSLLIAFMATTAVLGWMRRQLVVLPAFTTGILLICDAWFRRLDRRLRAKFGCPGADCRPRQPAARGDHDDWRSPDPASDSDTALFYRPRDAAVARAVAALTRAPGAAPRGCTPTYRHRTPRKPPRQHRPGGRVPKLRRTGAT